MKIKKAIITCGGKGTRMYPATLTIPKEMLPIGNIPAIDFAINECYFGGINDICLIYSENKYALVEYLYKTCNIGIKKDINFNFVPQNTQKGTAYAVYSGMNFVGNNDFYLIFPDEIYFNKIISANMIESYSKTGGNILGIKKVTSNECKKFGIIDYITDDNQNILVKKIVEKPRIDPPSNYALCGRFILNNQIFGYIERLKENNGEYYLTDAINFATENNNVFGVKTDAIGFDIGNPLGYLTANTQYLKMQQKNK